MDLTVEERLAMLRILPQEGDLLTARIVHQLRMDLSFSEDENAFYNFRQDGDILHLDNAEVTKSIPIGEKATEIITEAMKQLEMKKQFPVAALCIWDKFVDTTE